MLEPIAKEVSIIHRRDKFRAHEHSVENLHNSKVNVLTPFVPAELVGEDRIEQLVLEEVKGDRKEIIEIDDLIVNYGFVSSLGPIKNWGLEIEKIPSSSKAQWKRISKASLPPEISAHMKARSS